MSLALKLALSPLLIPGDSTAAGVGVATQAPALADHIAGIVTAPSWQAA
ncbi:MAG: hypothetical protein IPP44_28160 [Ideonella sp.]|jgi:hypothetical protein|nr:hypothetical protein [Ideonella sp.]